MLRKILKIQIIILILCLLGYLSKDLIRELYYKIHLEMKIVEIELNHESILLKASEVDEIVLIGNKEKKILELYFFKDNKYEKVREYPFTDYSGKLGPKLKRGDGQIPEGIYTPTFLNSKSSFYLSIDVGFPNEFDKSKGVLDKRENLGDNIFIHGKDVTIGCIPIGDEAIEELFLLVHKVGLEKTKIIITPNDLIQYPEIENIDWENELYDQIKKELEEIKKLQ